MKDAGINTSRSDAAYRHIRAKLLSGELSPGTRLVNRTLAREVGSSFIPVREAISRLASEGIVEQIAGAGAYVSKPDRSEIIELYGLRQAIECYAASEAAARIDDGQLERLAAVCHLWARLIEEATPRAGGAIGGAALEQWVDADIRFHHTIIEAAANRWVEKVARDVRLLSRVFGAKPDLLPPDDANRTLQMHVRLRRALKRRDAPAAAELMAEQIRAGLDFVLRRIDGGDGDAARSRTGSRRRHAAT